jgi:hypothetical protein
MLVYENDINQLNNLWIELCNKVFGCLVCRTYTSTRYKYWRSNTLFKMKTSIEIILSSTSYIYVILLSNGIFYENANEVEFST